MGTLSLSEAGNLLSAVFEAPCISSFSDPPRNPLLATANDETTASPRPPTLTATSSTDQYLELVRAEETPVCSGERIFWAGGQHMLCSPKTHGDSGFNFNLYSLD